MYIHSAFNFSQHLPLPQHTIVEFAMRLESRQLIEQLISFDSVSRHSNLPLLEFIQEYLDEHGVDSQLIYNDDRSKANLLACIGPKVAGGVVLSGHSEVVPVDGQRSGERRVGKEC